MRKIFIACRIVLASFLIAGAASRETVATADAVKPLQSPVVQVGSRYSNEGPPAPLITEIGAGFLVDLPLSEPNTQFVFTDSHNIGGENPWVQINGVRVKAELIHERGSDTEGDVAILRIPRTQIESAYSYTSETGLQPHPNLLWRLHCLTGGTLPIPEEVIKTESDGAARHRECPPVADDQRLRRITFSSEVNGTKEDLHGSFLSPAWASPGSENGTLPPGLPKWKNTPRWFFTSGDAHSQPEGYQSEGRPFNSFDGGHFVVPALTTGGNSGSFAIDESFQARFLGTAVQYNYFFRHVKVAGPELFTRLIERRSPKVHAPRWRMKNGLLYLDFGDGVMDIDFMNAPSGKGVIDVPAGNGVTAPPGGNGVTAPPGGNGVTAPPGGNGVTAQPAGGCEPANNNDVSSAVTKTQTDVLAASEILLGKKKGLDPGEIYKRFRITPYMSRNGVRLYGFEIRDSSGHFRATLYPNTEAYQWVRRLEPNSGFTATPLTAEPDFAQMLEDKLRAQLDLDSGGQASSISLQFPVQGRPFVLPAPVSQSIPGEIDFGDGCHKVVSVELEGMGYPRGTRVPLEKPMTYCDGRKSGKSGPPKEAELKALEHHGVAEVEIVPGLGQGGREIHLRWKFVHLTAQANGERSPTSPCLLNPTDLTLDDEVELRLDQHGRALGKKYFEPVLLVTSRLGRHFYLDLRPQFFTDLSLTYPATIHTNWARESQPLKILASQVGLELTPVPAEAEKELPLAVDRFVQFHAQEHPRSDGKISCESFEKHQKP